MTVLEADAAGACGSCAQSGRSVRKCKHAGFGGAIKGSMDSSTESCGRLGLHVSPTLAYSKL